MKENFKFGLETEYCLMELNSKEVLWYEKLNFTQLLNLISNISLEGIPSLEGLDDEPAHPNLLPYVIEGYHLKDENFKAFDMHPKGVEIRSPVCNTIEECISIQKILYERLINELHKNNLTPLILGHHPWASNYIGEKSNRPDHFWKWALRAMTTFGPDFNISWNTQKGKKLFLNKSDFEEKLNYYAPALVAFSSNGPFFENELLKNSINQKFYKSIRALKRSEVAPLIEWHENENYRIEFKFFEMPISFEECHLFFNFCLILMLTDNLSERASKENGLLMLKEAANYGLESIELNNRVLEMLEKGIPILEYYGFDTNIMKLAYTRLIDKKTPSDYLIADFLENKDLNSTLNKIKGHTQFAKDWIELF